MFVCKHDNPSSSARGVSSQIFCLDCLEIVLISVGGDVHVNAYACVNCRPLLVSSVWALAAVCMNNDENMEAAVVVGCLPEVQRAKELYKDDEEIVQKCMFLVALFEGVDVAEPVVEVMSTPLSPPPSEEAVVESKHET